MTDATTQTPGTAATISKNRISAVLGATFSIVMIGIALWFLHHQLAGLTRDAIVGHIKSIPPFALLAAVGCATSSYLVLTLYDATALRYLNRPLPYIRSALTAFMAYAIGHNVGFVALSGGTIRYRMYTLAGLTASEVARLTVFVTFTFALGASALLGVALVLMPASQTAILKVPSGLIVFAGGVLLTLPVIYVVSAFFRHAPIKLRHWNVAWPRPSIALTQVAISIADLTFAAATLYVLLEPVLHIGFLPFLGIYLLAMAAGLISSVPGGIGVFEAVLVAALPQVDPSALLGTIIIYRLIYYVAPLSIALTLLVGHESRQHGVALKHSMAKAGGHLSGIAPQVMAVVVFLAGLVLLVSGASPAIETRLDLIARHLPLAMLELSHLAGSVIGVGLLILARGLYRRLNAAYIATLVALAAGMAASLLKGLDYEETIMLGIIVVALWFSRGEFYRLGTVTSQRFSTQWFAAIAIVLGISLWTGLMSYRHVAYSDQLWWQFATNAQAPRMLRASVLSATIVLAFALWKILRIGVKTSLPAPVSGEQALVQEVLAQATSASANVALLGDKRFLWSADQKAFIMYQISGDSWIALGDPVGPTSHHEELAWAFRDLVDRHHGRTVFYQVGDESLSLYVDLGMTMSKLGEDARVSLDGFTLEGSHRAALRQADNKAKKLGAVFEIVPQTSIDTIMPDLRRVSDSWLAEKSTAEKGFSLGAFSENYIANFDCAVVRVDGAVVAFANLWPAPAGGELSIDLMRFDKNAPKGVMDYLFAELMLWGAANQYQWFSLGMAPLSGLEKRALAPLWHKVGHLVFTHGEHFYNFDGLRKYKSKFEPTWQPRYLACPGGWWNLSRGLFDASRLISGGVAGLLGK